MLCENYFVVPVIAKESLGLYQLSRLLLLILNYVTYVFDESMSSNGDGIAGNPSSTCCSPQNVF